jgi:hypothetical protein
MTNVQSFRYMLTLTLRKAQGNQWLSKAASTSSGCKRRVTRVFECIFAWAVVMCANMTRRTRVL